MRLQGELGGLYKNNTQRVSVLKKDILDGISLSLRDEAEESAADASMCSKGMIFAFFDFCIFEF